MKDEIKEILDIEEYRNKDGYVENINLLPDEIHKLSDYITNLQEENKSLKASVKLLDDIRIYLNDKIDKAINYMNNTYDIIDIKELFYHYNKVESILKGENNEKRN